MTCIKTTRPAETTIIGPFSHWPHRKPSRRRIALVAGGAASIGVFLHCIAPTLMMA